MLVPVEPLLQVTVPPQPVAVSVAVSLPHKLVLLLAIVGAFGVDPVVITTAFDAPLVPQVVVHIAVYVPAVPTAMLVPVEPLLQVTVPPQPVAVKVAVSLPHKLVLLLAIVGALGEPPIVITIAFDAPLVPHAVIHVAVYVPAVPTVMLVPVEPLLQATVPPQPVAVRVAVSLPHKLVLLLAIVGAVGVPPVVITIALDAPLVPQAVTHVAVYVPAMLTVMPLPVALVFHFTVPPQPLAVNVAVSLPHKLVLLLAMVGAPGEPPVVIAITFEVGLVPQVLTQTAV